MLYSSVSEIFEDLANNYSMW